MKKFFQDPLAVIAFFIIFTTIIIFAIGGFISEDEQIIGNNNRTMRQFLLDDWNIVLPPNFPGGEEIFKKIKIKKGAHPNGWEEYYKEGSARCSSGRLPDERFFLFIDKAASPISAKNNP